MKREKIQDNHKLACCPLCGCEDIREREEKQKLSLVCMGCGAQSQPVDLLEGFRLDAELSALHRWNTGTLWNRPP